jgi:hypothetical protein
LLGYGRHIDRDERALSPVTFRMDGLGQMFFAHTRFSEKQQTGIAGNNLLNLFKKPLHIFTV